jgi:hypothetical protein
MDDVVHIISNVLDDTWERAIRNDLHLALFIVEILDSFTGGFRVPLPDVEWNFLELMAFACYSERIRLGAPESAPLGPLLDALRNWLGPDVRSLTQFLSLDRRVAFPPIDCRLIPIHFGIALDSQATSGS